MKWLATLVVLIFVGLFSIFYWTEVADPRSDREILVNEKLLQLIAEGNTKIKISDLIEGAWGLACLQPSYARLESLLPDYVSREIIEKNPRVYADNYWGVVLISDDGKSIRHQGFEKHNFGSPNGPTRCLPYKSAGFLDITMRGSAWEEINE